MTSFVDIDDDISMDFDPQDLILKLMDKVTEVEQCPYETCVNVCITHSDEVKELNSRFRDLDETTDVLSFPMLDIHDGDFGAVDESDPSLFEPDSGELILGDIVINIDRVYSQAKDYGHSVRREFAFLVTHSLYHLCGYDHMNAEDERVMTDKQEAVLNALKITRETDV